MMHKAYLAGILDGEGCIQFTSCRDIYIPRIMIVNTHKPLLEDICAEFGGNIGQLSRAKSTWKPAYQWYIANSACVKFLSPIYDYLRIKQAQADLVFLWDSIRPGYNGRWTEELREALDLIVAQSRWLNGRGVAAQTEPEPMAVALQEMAA